MLFERECFIIVLVISLFFPLKMAPAGVKNAYRNYFLIHAIRISNDSKEDLNKRSIR